MIEDKPHQFMIIFTLSNHHYSTSTSSTPTSSTINIINNQHNQQSTSTININNHPINNHPINNHHNHHNHHQSSSVISSSLIIHYHLLGELPRLLLVIISYKRTDKQGKLVGQIIYRTGCYEMNLWLIKVIQVERFNGSFNSYN
ncbi:hypothetical protein ACTA71_011851 [Dictyostelium dimigraforme]